MREMVLGSEGRMGILTEVTVRVRPLATEAFHAAFFPDFEQGQSAVREILQAALPLSMLRLSTPTETKTTLALSGRQRLIAALGAFLSVRGIREEKCMLLLGMTGRKGLIRTARKEALGILRKHGGVHVGRRFGRQWYKTRFRTPYLRNTLWEMGYAVDTLETATVWAGIPKLLEAVESSLRHGLSDIGERVHVFTHLSHLYPSGSSIYTTYLYRIATDPDETLQRWKVLKTAAMRAILAHGGTISHQHGVGEDHIPYLSSEKGPLGMAALSDLCTRFDPTGIMNPGKLVPSGMKFDTGAT
jgi:alkyldihydroxyacetonephosphate synthase